MTMDINERGKKYAEGKALSALNAAIEQAYIDGYNDGLKHLENEKLEAIKEGVEYVDLGLPSGTLWSSSCLNDGKNTRKLPYIEASKLSIPTKEQFEELISNCKCHEIYGVKQSIGVCFIGNTGRRVRIPFVEIDELNRGIPKLYFWVRDDCESNSKDIATIDYANNKTNLKTDKVFMGYNLPVMLVKKKQK